MNNSKLTSVKILEDLYKRFKSTTVNTKMTLQKLTNRSIDLYLTDNNFKDTVETHNDLTISGGTVNNSVIGGSTPAAITGTTIDANTDFTIGSLRITDDQIQMTPLMQE